MIIELYVEEIESCSEVTVECVNLVAEMTIESGARGIAGVDGTDGVDGKSAYQSYLDTTSDVPPLTEAQWAGQLGAIYDILITI